VSYGGTGVTTSTGTGSVVRSVNPTFTEFVVFNHAFITTTYVGGSPLGGSPYAGGVKYGDGTGWRFAFARSNGVIAAYVRDQTVGTGLNFTGQHRCFVDNMSFENIQNNVGLIVTADNNDYINMSIDNTSIDRVTRGLYGISINESLPIVSLARKYKDKSVFGVISSGEDPNNREDIYGNFVTILEKEKGDTRAYINSVGEGAIWVIDDHGSFESGDYITSSNVLGYGTRQEAEYMTNYTVAKITMKCDFTQPFSPLLRVARTADNEPILDELGNITWVHVRDGNNDLIMEPRYNIRYVDEHGTIITSIQYQHIKENGGNAYIAAFVGCTYHCG